MQLFLSFFIHNFFKLINNCTENEWYVDLLGHNEPGSLNVILNSAFSINDQSIFSHFPLKSSIAVTEKNVYNVPPLIMCEIKFAVFKFNSKFFICCTLFFSSLFERYSFCWMKRINSIETIQFNFHLKNVHSFSFSLYHSRVRTLAHSS